MIFAEVYVNFFMWIILPYVYTALCTEASGCSVGVCAPASRRIPHSPIRPHSLTFFNSMLTDQIHISEKEKKRSVYYNLPF